MKDGMKDLTKQVIAKLDELDEEDCLGTAA